MTRILFALVFTAPAFAWADCPSEKECEALWLWRSTAHVTLHVSRSDLSEDQTVGYSMEVRGREVLYSFQRGTTNIRLLMVPPIASLYSGLESTTTCRDTGDTEPYLASKITLPLGYLAKAFPKGPGSIVGTMTKDITVRPGRMYVDPGNHIEVKRTLKVSLTATSDQPSGDTIFSITEQAKSSDPKEPQFLYRGRWSKEVATTAIPDTEPLSSWLVCAWSGSTIDGELTLGDLREKSNSIER